jgi:23S rRNA (adenine2503-C2)-methyltransferase
MKRNIKNLNEEELINFFDSIGEKKYRIKQLYHAIYSKKYQSFEEISNFSIQLQKKLSSEFFINSLLLVDYVEATDGSKKIIFSTCDNEIVETIFLTNAENEDSQTRNTLCISTMIGCPVNCKFCATAKLGYIRDLDTSEILDQIILAQKYFGEENNIKNIVIMGMGEPFLNYENLMNAIKIIRHNNLFSDKSITISTIGIPDRISDFANMDMKIKIALSLHSPFDDIRQKLIPIAKKYKIEEILKSLDYYYRITHLPITFEYTLFQGINNREEDAKKLIRMARRFPSKVNLIPYNDISFIDSNIGLVPCSDTEIKEFAKMLHQENILVITRKSQGSDILAACGQLAFSTKILIND